MTCKCATYRLDVRADRGDKNDIIYRPPQGVVLPEAASLSQWRAPIRDQGEEGSCTGESGTGAAESLLIEAGTSYVELSPQYLYHKILVEQNGNARRDTGASIRTIPKALAKWGIAQEHLWGYAQGFAASPTYMATQDAAKRRIDKYMRVTSIYDAMYALAVDKLPVLIGISCYASLQSEAVAATGLIPLPVKGDAVVGGHALKVDSYGTLAGSLHFTGPNSWGNDWGGLNDAPTAAGERRGLYHAPEAFLRDSDCLNDIWVLKSFFQTSKALTA